MLRYESGYHDFTHTIWSDLSKGQGILCSQEQIKVSQWLNLIIVAKQQQPDLDRLRKFFMFHSGSNQGHCSRWVFSVYLTSWYSSTSFLSGQLETAIWVPHSGWFGLLSWLLSDIYDSSDLLQVSLYCLNSDMHWVGWMWGNVRKTESRTNITIFTDVEKHYIMLWVYLAPNKFTQTFRDRWKYHCMVTAKNNIMPYYLTDIKLTSGTSFVHLTSRMFRSLYKKSHGLWLFSCFFSHMNSYMKLFYYVQPHPSNVIPVSKCCLSYECSSYIERGALRT